MSTLLISENKYTEGFLCLAARQLRARTEEVRQFKAAPWENKPFVDSVVDGEREFQKQNNQFDALSSLGLHPVIIIQLLWCVITSPLPDYN